MNEELIPFKETEIQEMIIEAVNKFFTMMIDWPVAFVGARNGITPDEIEGPPPPVMDTGSPLIVSMVGFVGDISGVINLYLEEDHARKVTSAFLGLTEEEVREEEYEFVNDALGEMANMTVGTFKNSICDKGHNCRLTLPSILRGSHFSIETPNTVFRRIYEFKSEGCVFVVDVTMKPEL